MAISTLDDIIGTEIIPPPVGELTDRDRLRFLADVYGGYGDGSDPDRLDMSWLQPED